MIRKVLLFSLLTGLLLCIPRIEIADAAEQVGSATKIIRSVTGRIAGRSSRLNRGDAVFRKQRVRAASASFGQFRLNDNSNLAVNANSSIILDRFVFSDNASASKLVLKAARGAFRFATGSMPSKAYKVRTPSSTIGVRGTMFDVFVGNRGQTIVTVLHGSVRACNRRGRCRTLNERCESLRIEPDGRFIQDSRPNRRVLGSSPARQAIPFLVSQRLLNRGLRIPPYAAARCASSSAINDEDDGAREGTDSDAGGHGGGQPSDKRLKRDIQFLEKLPNGLKLYRFKYNWSDTEFVGVMAQDVLNAYPETVSVGAAGFYRVDYGMLGVRMMPYKDWQTRNSEKLIAAD